MFLKFLSEVGYLQISHSSNIVNSLCNATSQGPGCW